MATGKNNNAATHEIAIHEAAHAVIGRGLGLVCGETSLTSPDGLGHAHVERRWKWREREYGAPKQLADAFCIALYAAVEAERAILGVADPDGDDEDQHRATRALCDVGGVRGASYVGDEVWERHEAKLRRKAASLVTQHRASIERVARVLIDRGRLEAAEIDALLAERT